MTTSSPIVVNPALDLVLERVVDVPPSLVWAAWTTPTLLMPWFCPRPWLTVACHIDLRPGGEFSTTMQSPEGETFPNTGCYLEVIPESRLTWTSTLLPGFRPAPEVVGSGPHFHMTGSIMLEPHGSGTKYTAIALHNTEAQRVQHESMGFQEGWGTALDQLVAHMKSLPRG
jgi:uncharacterized protein YndB with AHSA1/START domain